MPPKGRRMELMFVVSLLHRRCFQFIYSFLFTTTLGCICYDPFYSRNRGSTISLLQPDTMLSILLKTWKLTVLHYQELSDNLLLLLSRRGYAAPRPPSCRQVEEAHTAYPVWKGTRLDVSFNDTSTSVQLHSGPKALHLSYHPWYSKFNIIQWMTRLHRLCRCCVEYRDKKLKNLPSGSLYLLGKQRQTHKQLWYLTSAVRGIQS